MPHFFIVHTFHELLEDPTYLHLEVCGGREGSVGVGRQVAGRNETLMLRIHLRLQVVMGVMT